jgi:flagellar hook protein FlgE
MRVQGFQADEEGTVSGVLGDLEVETNDLAPRQTTDVETLLNLDSSEEVLADSGSTIDSDGTTIGTALAGANNGYTPQTIDVTLADGTVNAITTAADATAGATAAQFSLLNGVDATARTSATILSANYSNAGTMNVTVNGITFQPSGATTQEQLANLGAQINESALVGITAVLNGTDLEIIQDQGADLQFAFAGAAGDRFDVQGTDAGATTVELGTTASTSAVVGGSVQFILDDNVSFANNAGTSIVATFVGQPFTNNAFDPADAGTYNHATSTTIYDSLGNSHILSLYFVKQEANASTQPNSWQMHVQIDGQDVGDPLIGNTASRATFNIVFNDDGSVNELVTDDVLISNWVPSDADGNPNGAAAPINVVNGGSLPVEFPPTSSNFEIDLATLTQYGSPFAVNDLSQNGFTTGRLVGLDVDSSGVILSRFSNGESLTLGQVALANFRDKEGLAPIGDSVWVETFSSGDAVIGSPGTASLGVLTASAVESSNVDLSQELVNLIVAQRNYQANSKTIETADTIQQTILNI